MELGSQIKKYRNEFSLSQDALAEKLYVSRQTISNWENDKSYPDVKSLLLLSEVFKTSIDNLIKGDVEIMKEFIKKEEIEKMNHYGIIYTLLLIAIVVSAVPLFLLLHFITMVIRLLMIILMPTTGVIKTKTTKFGFVTLKRTSLLLEQNAEFCIKMQWAELTLRLSLMKWFAMEKLVL